MKLYVIKHILYNLSWNWVLDGVLLLSIGLSQESWFIIIVHNTL